MTEFIVSLLSGAVMPTLLLFTGVLFCKKLGFFWIIHPIKTARSLISRGARGAASPLRALTLALAGTLGVGNIAGVATAITAGGAGAVFWMWMSALLAMGIKYAEVAFSLAHRRNAGNARAPHFYGGAMYYMRDTVGKSIGAIFALLCIANAAVTGNVIQTNAASSVFAEQIPPVAIGCAFAVLALAVTLGPARRISDVTIRLIPALVLVYLLLSVAVIASNISRVPSVFLRIFGEAFAIRSALAGAAGTAVSRAIRYGVTRGILSNEAGSGTSPTAHAAADTDDPHRQGVFGIFEVFADTIVICTLTAVVILLLSDFGGEDGVRLAVLAYSTFAGKWAGELIRVSVVLFAFATVICQAYYGQCALEYFTHNSIARRVFLIIYCVLCIVGSVIDTESMWLVADLVISSMTVLNVCVLLFAFSKKRCRKELLPWAYRLRK